MLIQKKTDKQISEVQIETVRKQKQEYKLIGTYLRTRGLKLFSYNHSTGEIKEVEVTKKETLHLIATDTGLGYKDKGFEKANVDARETHFEALNMKNAQRRVYKFKEGKISDLCNLRKPGTGIKIF